MDKKKAKVYTSLEQSKKLSEILPLESADMHYCYDYVFDELESIPTITEEDDHFVLFPKDIRCWSLAALLEILSERLEYVNEAGMTELSYGKIAKWCVSMLNCGKIKDCYANNPVDACYEMIIKLHELNLL